MCKTDSSNYLLKSPLKQNIKDEIMDIKIFNEKIAISEEELKDHISSNDLETVQKLFKDGEKALSLNEIIQTRSHNLEKLIFEIDQSSSSLPDEEGFSQVGNISVKQTVQIKMNQIEEDGDQMLIQLVDMTEHMALSELKNNYQFNQFKSKNEVLSMINACVSHELRNPLNSIIATNIEKKHLYMELKLMLNQEEINRDSCLEILNKLEEGNKVQEKSATMMLFMVQDLLDMAQIKSDKFRKNITSFNIMNAVETVINIQNDKAFAKDLKLYAEFVNIDPLNAMICSDEQRIQQVLLGLQSNALKFTQEGEIKIRVEIQELEKDKPMLVIEVIDTGIGISEENQKKLFQLFGLLEDKKQLNKNGIGLGLTIAKDICQVFGGDISIQSEVGKGSTFKFYFDISQESQ